MSSPQKKFIVEITERSPGWFYRVDLQEGTGPSQKLSAGYHEMEIQDVMRIAGTTAKCALDMVERRVAEPVR